MYYEFTDDNDLFRKSIEDGLTRELEVFYKKN